MLQLNGNNDFRQMMPFILIVLSIETKKTNMVFCFSSKWQRKEGRGSETLYISVNADEGHRMQAY